MSQSTQLLETLKKELRASGVNYREVGEALELSEASIKRLFAEGSFTLGRLETVCNLAGLSLVDLMQKSQQSQRRLEMLSVEQEQEIANDVTLLMVAVSVINGFSFADLLAYYKLSEHECVQKLARLDKIKFLELLPGNKIKLLISPNFRWQKNGAIQKFFHDKVEKDFFSSRFDGEQDKLLVLNGLFSAASNKIIQEKIDNFSVEFNELMKRDAALPTGEKSGTTMVLALREWKYSLFSEFVR